MTTQNNEAATSTLAARLTIGVLQGAALYVLTEMAQSSQPEFTKTWMFSVLCLIAGLLPFIWLASIGSMRRTTLAVWTIAITGLIVATVSHASWRLPMLPGADHLWLAFPLTILLFIGHHLVAAADADGKPIANYASYFDIGWKNGVQLALSLAFLGAFWLLLFLGAGLFELLKITLISEIISKAPFISLASCIVFAIAVHITDVRVSLITGARTMALILLSWLLPLMALFAIAFLVTLVFTGLTPLWATGQATPMLITAGAVLVVLINAAYQDGDEERTPGTVLKLAVRLASLALVPVALISFYSVWLRVQQYGLTPDRVIALAFAAVGSIYAVGYAVAALWPGRWMQPLQITNIIAAVAWVAVVAGMLTPLADPYRLSVENQVNRLKSGHTSLATFDFDFLKFDAGRYGELALAALANDKTSATVSAAAEAAMKRTGRVTDTVKDAPPMTQEELSAGIKVFPAGATLPASFLQQEWKDTPESPIQCVRYISPPVGCQARLEDIDRDNRPEVLLRKSNYEVQVYRETAGSVWVYSGKFLTSDCDTSNPLDFSTSAIGIAQPAMNDLEFAGRRYRLVDACPPLPAPAK
jgi:hypothetical protein